MIASNWPVWFSRLQKEYNLDPWASDIKKVLTFVYVMLLDQAQSDFGILLKDVPQLDQCIMADLDGEDRQREQERYLRDVCSAPRVTHQEQLNWWLDGSKNVNQLMAVKAFAGDQS